MSRFKEFNRSVVLAAVTTEIAIQYFAPLSTCAPCSLALSFFPLLHCEGVADLVEGFDFDSVEKVDCVR